MCLINMYFHWTTFQGMQYSVYLLTSAYRQLWASLSCLVYPVSAVSLQQKKPRDFRSEASPFLCKLGDFPLKVKYCVHRTDFQMCAVLVFNIVCICLNVFLFLWQPSAPTCFAFSIPMTSFFPFFSAIFSAELIWGTLVRSLNKGTLIIL